MEEQLNDQRCITCNSLMFKYSILSDIHDVIVIEVKCSRCNSIKRLEIDIEYLLKMYQIKKQKKEQKQRSETLLNK
jgi:phage FluMu protein Com